MCGAKLAADSRNRDNDHVDQTTRAEYEGHFPLTALRGLRRRGKNPTITEGSGERIRTAAG
jgi:hypothetical protein